MKSFALFAALAVIASAQGDAMTEEEIAALFDNNSGGLISPAPAAEGEEGASSTGSAIVDSVANKEDVQDGIDWVRDLYNTLCGSLGSNHDEMNHDDMNHDMDGTTPKEGDPTTTPVDPDMPTPAEPAEHGSSSGDWDMDMDSSTEWLRLTRLHRGICDTLHGAHGEMSKWHNADSAGRQEIEDKYGEDVMKFFEDFFEGAMGSFAVAGTALAASVAVLTF